MIKKFFCAILVVSIVVVSLAGCSSNNTKEIVKEKTEEKKEEKISKQEFGKVMKVDDMLYEVTYDEYSKEVPSNSAYEDLAGDMGCSSVRNGNFVGRNFDYFMNQSPTFVVHTTAKEDRYATIGVGRLAKINEKIVENGIPQEKLDHLPWIILDGMNEKGLVANSNVAPISDWGEIPHTGTKPGAPELNVIFIVRAILDKCATADEAIAYLNEQNITPMGSRNFDLHFMISDTEKTYIVEFINNKLVVEEQYFLTNYFVNIDTIPDYPIGLERLMILKENYDEGSTMEGMYNLMKRVRYTNSYYASNKWYSEKQIIYDVLHILESDIDFTYSQIQKMGDAIDEDIENIQKKFEEEKKYVEKNGLREKTEWWDTVHNTIYDIENKKIWVTVHEQYEKGPHEFYLNSENALTVETEKIADLVVYGNIYTVEEENMGLAEAFAVKDGKYIYVGSRDGIKPFIKEGKTEVIDRTGKGLIIPGCTEGHSHYMGIYGVQSQLPCANCSYKEMLDVIKEQVASGDITQFGTFGWNASELSERREAGYNFAEEIESIAPGIPVVLLDNTGHNAVCNKTALIKSGIMEHPEVRGGEVCLDKEGKPSGYVSDQAVGYVFEKTIDNLLTKEQFQKACIVAQNMLLRMGYTNVFDAYLNQFDETSVFETLKDLDDKGELKLNVAASYNIKSCDADIFKEKVDRVETIARTNRSKHFDPRYIKLFADGVTESGTGWMLNEYKNASKGKEHGNKIWEPNELLDVVSYANSKDILIHTHSYGDAACKAVIDAYIASNEANKGEYRNCLGHVRNIKKEDVIRAAENKIPIAANLIWHTDYDDNNQEELKYKNRLIEQISEETYYSGYPMKSLFDKGVIVSSSTDAPAAMTTEGTAMNVLEVAVTGVAPNDSAKPFAEEELLTIEEGLKALTINGAWQLGLEEERGSIKKGKYADFVILDNNILEYRKDEYNKIGDTKVLGTYFEGNVVYLSE